MARAQNTKQKQKPRKVNHDPAVRLKQFLINKREGLPERLGSITLILHLLDPTEDSVRIVTHTPPPADSKPSTSSTETVLIQSIEEFRGWVSENLEKTLGKDYDFESFLSLREYRKYIKQVSQEFKTKWCIAHARPGNGKVKNKRGRPEKMLAEFKKIADAEKEKE